MSGLWLQNLSFYCLQIAVVAGAGALLVKMLGIRIASARLLCWQSLMALCLVLPAIQPWLSSKTNSKIQITLGPALAADAAHGSHLPEIPVAQIILAMAVAGVAVRFGFLGLGFLRLRRYRRTATFVPGAFAALQQRLGVFADFQVSNDVSGPVTFGLLRPTILLPQDCLQDESIACHELIHVRRRDWLFAVIEECVLSLLWFHPALWWITAEIQLAREEAVDREVVAILKERSRYLDSLLSLAASRAGLDLVPASPFLRKRHLQKRVAALLKEVSMTKFRITTSLAAFSAFIAITAWLGVRSFPLEAAPQDNDSPNVVVHAGPIPLAHRAPVLYPKEAQDKGIVGTVVLELTIDNSGAVTDARVLSGPEELRGAALHSVLEWHYARDSQPPPHVEVSIDFNRMTEAAPGTLLAPPEELARLDRVKIVAPEPMQKKLAGVLTLHEGTHITQNLLNEVAAAVRDVDEHLRVSIYPNAAKNGSIILVSLEGAAANGAPKKIRVGGNVQAANIVNRVDPVYPPEAKQNHIQGLVRFTVIVGKDGTVQSITLVSSPDALLTKAAQDAVQQWVYRPTLLNGDPVEVVTTVDVNFTLSRD
jgi:TonB family protein